MPRVLALLLPLLLSACFDLREEVRVEPDGSGRLTFDYTVPREAIMVAGGEVGIREKIDALLVEEPKVRLETLEITDKDDRANIHIEIAADSMLALGNLKETEAFQELPATSRNLAGTFDVRIDGTSVRVDRRIEVARALGFAALAIGAEDREQRQLEYIIHLPKAAAEHNADTVENGGRTLIWKRSLGAALDGPVLIHYAAPIPLPVWFIPAVILVAMLAILGLITLVRRIRRRWKRNAAPVATP